MKRFARIKVRDYELRNPDGTTSRHVIALYAGNKKFGFLEYDTAYDFVNRVHDLTEAHEQKGQTHGTVAHP